MQTMKLSRLKTRRESSVICHRRRLGAAFAEYSTLHGINDLYRAGSWPLRFFWAVIITVAVGAAIYGCFAIVGAYLRSPVVVSYFVRGNESLTLPDIVVCPLNRFNRSYLNQFNFSDDLVQYLELSFPSVMISPLQWERFMQIYSKIFVLEEEFSNFLRNIGKNFTEFIEEATDFDCRSIIVGHTIDKYENGTKVGRMSCTEWPSYRISSGKCFRIPGRPQEAAGFGYGSRVTISIPRDLYSPALNQLPVNGIVLKLMKSDGAINRMDSRSATQGLDTDLAFVPAGVYALVALKTTRYEFINDPPRYECIQNANDTYSRVACFDKCLTQEAEEKCNCSPAASPTPAKPLCTAFMYWTCFFSNIAPVLNKANGRMNFCREKCKPLCSYWEYTTTISYANYPSPEFRHFVPDNETWNQLFNHIILEIYYENLEYTTIKHFPSMEPDSFLAQLGGQVSLWVGGSILTLIQLIMFLLQMLFSKVSEILAKKGEKTKLLPQETVITGENCNYIPLPLAARSVSRKYPAVVQQNGCCSHKDSSFTPLTDEALV